MGDITPYINKRFYRHAESVLLRLAQKELFLKGELATAEMLLTGDYGDSHAGFTPANIDAIPTAQVEWVSAHDNLTAILNDRLLGLGYLFKNSNFIPKLIKKFGPEYNHSVSLQNNRVESSSIDLAYFSTPENVQKEMFESITFIFHYLHGLRANFTPETYNELENNKDRDPVSFQFFQGRLPEPNDMASYVEAMFFLEFDIPLGCLQAHDHVEKWIGRSVKKTGMGSNLSRVLSAQGILEKFPGITCLDLQNKSTLTSKTRYDFSTALWGITPSQGINLGHDNEKQQRFKPRIVYQSPR